MSRPRPPYLIRRKDRQGNPIWYVWKRPGRQIRIYAQPYGSREFMDEYRRALFGEAIPRAAARMAPGSLAALIADYQASDRWAHLADSTRADRGRILQKISLAAGSMPVSAIDRALIIETRERAGGPFAAKSTIETLRAMFKWAVDLERMDHNPADDVRVHQPKTPGYHTWTDEEISRFEERWPLGTRERLWFAVLLHTGLRRGDAVKLKWAAIRDGVIETTASKTKTPLSLPIMPGLQAAIDAGPRGRVYVIESSIGEPFTPASFSILFGRAARAAGCPGSAHGLRKAAATRLAHASATVPELNAVMGWTGSKMAMRYTEKAERARLAKQAFEKAGNK